MLRALKSRRSSRWSVLRSAAVSAIFASGVTLGVVSIAGAIGPTSGSQVPGAAAAVGTFTTGTPFSSGQNINVQVPANSIFPHSAALFVVECSAPGMVLPTDPSTCDGNTVNGSTLFPNADGSVDYQADSGFLYQIFALPDATKLGELPGGPVCNLTTPCVLYIGENQNDFTQPHVWSQFFYVQPNSDDLGENPGDGSPPAVGTLPSASKSTVTVDSPTRTGEGHDPATVTVTLLTTGLLPVPGKAVSLSQGAGSSTVQPATPGSNVTDANGVATFTATDNTAQSVTYMATDTTDNVGITQTAAVNFDPPVVTQASSSVVAASGQVAIAPATDLITVTLHDQAVSPQPVAGKVVSLTGTGSAVITPTIIPDITNGQGVATFEVSDPTAEPATFTATDVSDGITLTQKPQVTFGTLVVSPTDSTLTASTPIAQIGTIGDSVTVTLLTTSHSPVAGKQVSLTVSSPSNGAAPTTNIPQTTDANGQASFTVTDPNPEIATLNAIDETDGNEAVGATGTIQFEVAAPSATESKLIVTSPTAPADGQTTDPVEVTIEDQFGDPLPGKVVTLANSAGAEAECPPQASGSAAPGVTDVHGTAAFACNDTVAETVTFTATDTTDSFNVGQTGTITFTAGAANADVSTVTESNGGQNPSDGTTPAAITVTLNDFFGNRVVGKTISFTALNGSSQVTTVNAVTDVNGQAVFDAVDSTQEVVTYAAVDTTDNLPLTAQGVVIFGHPQAPPPTIPFSDVAAAPDSVVADGTDTSLITVTLGDPNGNYVPGKVVTLTAASGSSKITAVSATTGNTGTATFTVSDAAAETITYTATDTTDNVVLTGDEATVTFTAPAPGSAPNSTTTTTTTPPSATTAAPGSGATPAANGTGAALAATGTPALLPWLLGAGLFLLMFGALERRRVRGALS